METSYLLEHDVEESDSQESRPEPSFDDLLNPPVMELARPVERPESRHASIETARTEIEDISRVGRIRDRFNHLAVAGSMALFSRAWLWPPNMRAVWPAAGHQI